MVKRDCEFVHFCYYPHTKSDIKYKNSPCAKCKHEVVGEEVEICKSCHTCGDCKYEPIK